MGLRDKKLQSYEISSPLINCTSPEVQPNPAQAPVLASILPHLQAKCSAAHRALRDCQMVTTHCAWQSPVSHGRHRDAGAPRTTAALLGWQLQRGPAGERVLELNVWRSRQLWQKVTSLPLVLEICSGAINSPQHLCWISDRFCHLLSHGTWCFPLLFTGTVS